MAPLIKIAALLNLALLVSSQGTQFVTGPCASDADCAEGCCGFNTGRCAGPVIAQERDGGCGFGDAQSNANAAIALGFTQFVNAPPATPAAGAANNNQQQQAATPAVAAGTQFITGDCSADADCASGCCGFTGGKCAAPFVANERLEGCGFGNAAPNGGGASNAALVEGGAGNGQTNNNNIPEQQQAPAVAPGTQFITGPCSSDADCALGCCGFNTGKCAGPVVAQERDGGCGFGDAQPNDNAAQAFRNGQRLGRRGIVYYQ